MTSFVERWQIDSTRLSKEILYDAKSHQESKQTCECPDCKCCKWCNCSCCKCKCCDLKCCKCKCLEYDVKQKSESKSENVAYTCLATTEHEPPEKMLSKTSEL